MFQNNQVSQPSPGPADVTSESDLDHYFVDPEGLNLLNPFPVDQENEYNADLDHFLLDPNGVYLDNQVMSDSDNDVAFGLDPKPSPGPVDPG